MLTSLAPSPMHMVTESVYFLTRLTTSAFCPGVTRQHSTDWHCRASSMKAAPHSGLWPNSAWSERGEGLSSLQQQGAHFLFVNLFYQLRSSEDHRGLWPRSCPPVHSPHVRLRCLQGPGDWVRRLEHLSARANSTVIHSLRARVSSCTAGHLKSCQSSNLVSESNSLQE